MDFITNISIEDLLYVKEFEDLCNSLTIDLKSGWLEKKYDSIIRGQGDALVLYSKDKKSLIYINMYLSPTDQHNIIEFGVRVNNYVEKNVYKIINIIHSNATVKNTIQYGEQILDRAIDRDNYPKSISTITKDINEQIVYEYNQKLEEYYL